jgi:hypothetical protein
MTSFANGDGRLSSIQRRLAACVALSSALALPQTAKAVEKRPLPNYDGRPKRTAPADVAWWFPRLLLAPAYLVSEYVVRRPLGYAITAAERAELPSVLYDFFAFGPNHQAGIVPIAFVDFGFNPSVGLYSFWDDAGVRGNDVRLSGSTWGSDWLAGSLTDRIRYSDAHNITLTATAIRRPDYAFYGLGPAPKESERARYGADKVDVRVISRAYFWRASAIESTIGYRGMSFYRGQYEHEPSVTDRVREGTMPMPPGFETGYRAAFSALRIAVDSRERSGGSESGARLELDTEQGSDFGAPVNAGWWRYGASVGGFLDLNDRSRVLSLSVTAIDTEALGSRPIPFTELATLGGTETMPGFRAGRLYGESALVATLRYSWPVWMWLDGSLQASVGNVFGRHWQGATLRDSRFSSAIGVESNSSRDSIFQALLGFGTETFGQGAAVNSVRFVVGARHGF